MSLRWLRFFGTEKIGFLNTCPGEKQFFYEVKTDRKNEKQLSHKNQNGLNKIKNNSSQHENGSKKRNSVLERMELDQKFEKRGRNEAASRHKRKKQRQK